MKTKGDFDYRVVEIPAKYDQPINVFFHGDDHYNSPGFARAKWESDNEDMRAACKRGPTYFVKDGDTFEALSTSERYIFGNAGFHESNKERWEKEYAREIKQYVKEADFMVGRTLAVFGGNHYFQFWDGTTSDMALASALKAPYIGCSGYIILSLNIDGHHKHIVKIFVHHGLSSGRTAGSAFGALEKAAAYFHDADIIVMGHDHKAGAMQLPALACEMGKGGHWRIKECQRIIGRSGSYLKAYEPGRSSYAVDAMMRPSTLGCLQVILTPRRKCTRTKGRTTNDERWVQLKAVV